MAWELRYSLERAPEATTDGSGCILHDIQAVSRTQGTSDPFTPVPGRHKQIAIPTAQLNTVLAMPSGAAKVAAYKNALATNLDTQTVPLEGWGITQLGALLDANVAASTAAVSADTYVRSVGGNYPIRFNM